MIPWAMMGAGALMGALQTKQQHEEAKRQAKLQAEVARYSPWTGMKPQMVSGPNAMGNLMQGALTGAAMAQQFKAPQADVNANGVGITNIVSSRCQTGY